MKFNIKKKILVSFLSCSVVSLLICIIVCEINLMSLKDKNIESNNSIGISAANSSENALTDQALSNIASLASAKAETINNQLETVSKNLELIASYVNYLYANKDDFKLIEYNHAKDNEPDVLSMQYVLSPGMTLDDVKEETYLHGNMQSVYDSVMKANPSVTAIYLTTATGINSGYDKNSAIKPEFYEGRETEWYVKARDTGGLYVSETYQDSFGRGLTVTMSYPCYDGNNEFVGTVGLDILIKNLNETILKTNVGTNGYAMLISPNNGGKIISAPNLTETDETNLKMFLGTNYETIFTQMVAMRTGTKESTIDGLDMYIIFSPIALTNWSVAIILPKSDIIAPAVETKHRIENLTQSVITDLDNQIMSANYILIGLFAAIIIIVVIITLNISKLISEPIMRLTSEITRIGNGNFEYKSNINTGDEIETLSISFEKMTKELKEYVGNLAKVTADKQRIATELNVATQIQASMLPCIFPAFPEIAEFDIYATMHPAKEVGGDFYDFFTIDSSHLGVVIADVSGKGVPAALFMVIAKTLIKNHTQAGKSPADVFTTVNNQLCETNDAGMFVTAFMGIVDLKTGVFTYVNAGHNLPLVRHGNGRFEWLKMRAGFVLAGMEGIRYKQAEIKLEKGDRLYLYTDGVTESLNPQDELYSDERLEEALNVEKTKYMSLEELLEFMKEDIENFSDGAEQADDITMLALEFRGSGPENPKFVLYDLKTQANVDNLDNILDFVNTILQKRDCSMKQQMQIDVSAEEIFVNVANYAYGGETGDVTIYCGIDEDTNTFNLTFEDSGKPYNPLLKKDPDITLSADEREIGGLGILMTKKIMDDIDYEFKDGKNVLTLKKRL